MAKRLKNIIIIGSMFAYSGVFFKQPFEFYWAYLPFILFLPFYFTKFGIPKLPVLLFFPLLLIGVIYVQIGLNTSAQFYKIFIGYFASVTFYYYVVQDYNYDIEKLFGLYMQAAVVVALIAVVQIVSYKVGFTKGWDYNYFLNKWSRPYPDLRVNSIFSEPSYYGATMAPAFFISINNLINRKPMYISKLMSVVIIGTFAMTYSSVAYIGVFIGIALLLINYGIGRYALFIIPVLVFLTRYAYENVPDFRDRWDSTIEIYTTGNVYSYDVHGSSFVLYNNNHVAWQNFKRNPLTGTGLGSHATAFEKYTLTHEEGVVQIDFNTADANSMFLRLMSETGLYGIIIFLSFLIKHFVYKPHSAKRELWIISNACFLVIMLYLLRQGHYFINGLPFFIWLYYFTSKQNRDRLANPEYYKDEEEEEADTEEDESLVLKSA